MHQIRFGLGLRHRPCRGAHSVPQASSWNLGVLLLREGRGRGEGKKGKGRGERKGDVRAWK